VRAGDIVIGISGSGNSPNVVRAVAYAKTAGAVTIGLTGYDGGLLRATCDLSVHVPVHDMQIAEDLHLALNHLAMQELRRLAAEPRP
jgi:D-sedoheptulose 7-phosphate isomerase